MMGRKPAYCAPTIANLDGTISGYVPCYGNEYNVENLTQKIDKNQLLLTGNRIGHDPKRPKEFVPPTHHKRPPTLSEIISEFGSSYFETKLYKYLYHHVDVHDIPTRRIRSEFREMISLGCSVITHYYDAITGEIGFHNETGKFIRLSYEQLAEKINVSSIRIKRFFDFLKKRNMIIICQDREIDSKGNWKSNKARKIVPAAFFIKTLGMKAWDKIKKYRDYLFKKQKPKTKKQIENVSMLGGLGANLKKGTFKVMKKTEHPYRDPQKEQQMINDAIQAHKQDPSRSPTEWLAYIKQVAQQSRTA